MTAFRASHRPSTTSSPGYAKDNSKSYWEAHAKSWQGDVRASMQAPVTELSEEFGALRILRPNPDLRFSKDKTPYKTWTGATDANRAVGGIGRYLEVSDQRMISGCGAMVFDRDQRTRFRAAVVDDLPNAELEQIRADLDKARHPSPAVTTRHSVALRPASTPRIPALN